MCVCCSAYVCLILCLTLVGECLKFPFHAIVRGVVMENTSLASTPRSVSLWISFHLALFIFLLVGVPLMVRPSAPQYPPRQATISSSIET
jgi:hypothetical protein